MSEDVFTDMLEDDVPAHEQAYQQFVKIHEIPIGSWWRAADGSNHGCVVLSLNLETNDVTVLGTDGKNREIDAFKLQYRYAYCTPNAPSKVTTAPRLISDYFNDDGAPIRCPSCDSTNFKEKVIGVIDVLQDAGPTCEAEYYCECGACVGFWAYGAWYPQYREDFLMSAAVEVREL